MNRVLVFGLLPGVMALALCGCQNVSFYGQAIAGEYQILAHQKPIQKQIASAQIAPELKEKFQQVLEIRQFAAAELKLPVDSHYLKYVDLHRSCVVWNVYAAPELSLEAKTWWFPIVGRVSYRGYFSEAAARGYAAELRKTGLDVFVGGIPTYSTLGWFRDPLLNTFIMEPEDELADTIFHELAHQRLFVAGDTDFNEAFAMTVAQEGVRRWFLAKHQPEAFERYRRQLDRSHQFTQLVLAAVAQLKAAYSDPGLTDAVKRARKQEIVQQLRAGHEKLKEKWGGKSPFDGWFAGPINNAELGTVATYYELAPAFQGVLRAEKGDMESFYQTVKGLSKFPKEKRHQALRTFLQYQEAELQGFSKAKKLRWIAEGFCTMVKYQPTIRLPLK